MLDEVWYLAFTLSLQGIDAKAPAGWRPGVRSAFDGGLAVGEAERLERVADAELQAQWDGLAGDEDDEHEYGDYVGARRALPPAMAVD